MNFKPLNLGILGLSEGNGHPYSWSAIFNGYDKKKMENCGFPVIPRYLSMQKFPNDSIGEAKVTHIWTQSEELSEKIAQTCFIKNIVKNYAQMIGKVDAILLARDDAENHYIMSKPFLKEGLPIYIDKPLSFSLVDAKRILDLRIYDSQIFTCSAFKYAKEFSMSHSDFLKIGEIQSIKGYISKDWNKYSIHLIEPILNLIPNRGELLGYKKNKLGGIRNIILNYQNVKSVSISTIGDSYTIPKIEVIGKNGRITLQFKNTFESFRTSLKLFINSVIQNKKYFSEKNLLEIIKIIELGND